ncbi:hypothetical protein NEAUS04_1865 [Nematocida ausubeli]|uniref:Uncharacterized protein n=1 Tax=Nematocida ausubeli (strain ATCC PRA-371 / ERTm2) TaxID=1913371 RepID=H8ZCQ2_NEMA1|nr:uncharacterized protein NESG_02309 [Nematocida ausubeli]EHY65888.1 hypothetical protein NERG_01495 [Nematocida ausubeli]KAI5133045.1 hypothetical protein NEAUS06_0496 [Nematocida ausubeli]KAI5136785.1 hypothetical protein NEAUS07_1694 [Nematocida ausubeli]KAI5137187.1 hypothetical protein NEAUS07_1866 [Nematocida ausubeli]KAI5149424.1 hypothetical protein NEAUS05_1768 [Nematocida ausubeli]
MKEQKKKEKHIQAFESDEQSVYAPKVSDLVKTLEKSLNPHHFLNTRVNSQNIGLCEQLMKKKNDPQLQKEDPRVSSRCVKDINKK